MGFEQFAQWDKHMVCDVKIRNVSAGGVVYGFEFNLHYPTYRGTYLSCIEGLSFEIDGKPISDDDIEFHINNKQFLVSELKDLFAEYWFIRDDAIIRIVNNDGLESGSKHTIKAFMRHRIPYTGYFGQYGVADSVCEKTLETE